MLARKSAHFRNIASVAMTEVTLYAIYMHRHQLDRVHFTHTTSLTELSHLIILFTHAPGITKAETLKTYEKRPSWVY